MGIILFCLHIFRYRFCSRAWTRVGPGPAVRGVPARAAPPHAPRLQARDEDRVPLLEERAQRAAARVFYF